MEKGYIVQQWRGKSRHSAAVWKKKIQHSSVEKVDMAQQRGKVDMAQLGGKSRYGTAA